MACESAAPGLTAASNRLPAAGLVVYLGAVMMKACLILGTAAARRFWYRWYEPAA
jgi:hypothetical protein